MVCCVVTFVHVGSLNCWQCRVSKRKACSLEARQVEKLECGSSLVMWTSSGIHQNTAGNCSRPSVSTDQSPVSRFVSMLLYIYTVVHKNVAVYFRWHNFNHLNNLNNVFTFFSWDEVLSYWRQIIPSMQYSCNKDSLVLSSQLHCCRTVSMELPTGADT